MEKQRYYISTAIAYTSGKPHIGNTYEVVLADAIARFKRQQGYDVYFQTGTDEHGQKIELKAEEAGVTPKEFVDNVSGEIKRIWDLMNTSYDKFIRTTDEYHEKQVQKIFKIEKEEDIANYVALFKDNILPDLEDTTAIEKAKKDAIAEYEKANNLKGGKPIETNPKGKKGKKKEENEEEDDEEEFEWVELVDFTTSEARRYKKYNNAKNKI